MKCFIINYNRLTLPKNMADYLSECGIDVYIIDNNSTYEPLLEYYEKCNHKVLRMDDNYGYMVFWRKNVYDILKTNERYVLTDSDLDISHIPKDFLELLSEGLDKYPIYDKCGFSLKLDDLPDNEITKDIKNWEGQYWTNALDNNYFVANIDTTFALCKERHHSYSAIRTNIPYVAKHVPWYYENKEDIPDDELFYFNSISTPTHWSEKIEKIVHGK